MSRAIIRFGRPTLAALLLLILAQWSVILAFWNVRGLDGPLIFAIGVVGLVVGWVLGSYRIPFFISFPAATALGIEFLFLQIGQLGVGIISFVLSFVRLVARYVSWFVVGPFEFARGQVSVRAGPGEEALDALREGTALWEAVLTMAGRSWQWASGIAGGKPHFDPVAAALVWGLVLFLLAFWAAWMIRARSRPFEALLPTLVAAAALLFYTGVTGWSVLPVLAAMLSAMTMVSHWARERAWEKTGVAYSEELRIDLAIVMLPLTIFLLGFASLVPSISPGDIARSIQDALRDRPAETALTESFGIQPAPRPTTIFDAFGATGLPRQQLIGMRPDQSNQVVMTVRIEQGEEMSDVVGTRYYWRSLTYDRYSGTGWYAGGTNLLDRGAGEPAVEAKGFATRQVGQRVHVVQPDGLAYSAGQLITVDAPFRVARRSPSDVFSASVMKDDYLAESFLVIPKAAQLRASGMDYPDWVKQSYLDLPTGIPGRVLTLARELTAIGRTQYDRAESIETYLRTFPYTLEVPMPPPNRDVTDYFLFDLRRGYCDYYATAMVVLARASGLPARLVVGYATGTVEDKQGTFVVRKRDAHSWPEIYFSDYGWVEFEPTAGRAAIDRAGEARLAPRPQSGRAPGSPPSVNVGFSSYWFPVLAVVLLAFAGLVTWYAADQWQLARLTPDGAVSLVFQRMIRYGRRLGLKDRSSDTPFQIVEELTSRVDQVRNRESSRSYSTRTRRTDDHVRIAEIADAFVRLRYSGQVMADPDKLAALQNWRSLRWGMARAWVRYLTARVGKRFFKRSSSEAESKPHGQRA